MTRFLLKRLQLSLEGAFWSIIPFAMVALIDWLCGARGIGFFFCIIAAFQMMGPFIRVAYRMRTEKELYINDFIANWSRPDVFGSSRGIAVLISGCILASLSEPIFHLPIMPHSGWPERLAEASLLGAGFNWLIYEIEIYSRPSRRRFLPAAIRQAIATGNERYQEDHAIGRALDQFEEAIPLIIETAEAYGDHSIQLTFDAEEGANSSYGMKYDHLGWPKRSWGTDCERWKFVDRAAGVAMERGLQTEVIYSIHKKGFCLELSW